VSAGFPSVRRSALEVSELTSSCTKAVRTRPGRNLFARVVRLAERVGPPPAPAEPGNERGILPFVALAVAAGPLKDELHRRLRWMEDDPGVAILPPVLNAVEQALLDGWKPKSLGEAWTRVVLDPPPCSFWYYRCRHCYAPLPAVPFGTWHRRGGGRWPGSMVWFDTCPGCGGALETPTARGTPLGPADGVEWWFRTSDSQAVWLPHRPDWAEGA
jgi:hypothetical protein